MSRKIGNAQSHATLFRHSAAHSLLSVLLRKLPTIKVLYFQSFLEQKAVVFRHVMERSGKVMKMFVINSFSPNELLDECAD